AHALALGPDLDHRPAGVVDLPGDLPALGLAARDRLLELLHHLLERVALAVVQDGHPGRRDLGAGPGDLLDVRGRERPFRHAPDSTAAVAGADRSSRPAPVGVSARYRRPGTG